MIQIQPINLKRSNEGLFTKIALFLACSALAITTHAKTYYVSAAGKNTNSGTSSSSPWQSISKVNSFKFAANDIILFRRGDVFHGGIVVKRSNLSFGAYGSGNNPVITGLSTLSGWVKVSTNIWEAPASNVKKGVNLVLRNGTPQQVGRYPNTDASNGGYLTFTSATSTSLTGSAQSSTRNWTGAEVAFKANRWTINRRTVTSHSGGKITFSSNSTTPRAYYGYFFQRDSRTLDRDGEWWHNLSGKKLRMYFSNNNPGSYSVQVATVDTLFKCQYYNAIKISDIDFTGAGVAAIWFNGGSGVTINNCDVKNTGKEAITAKSTQNTTVQNCTTTNSLNSGIDVTDYGPGSVNLLVQNNTVTNTAYIAGMETNNVGTGEGIRCMGGDGVKVLNNKVINSGYIGIKWQGNNVYIKYNLVDKFCTQRDDGAGIYSWEDPSDDVSRYNRNIISNIVVNGIGSGKGTNETKETSVQGLYFDIGSKSVKADSNTVAYVANNGFHGNNCSSITITNNTFFKNGKSYSLQRFAGGELIRQMTIKKNIVYPYEFWYRNLGINSPSLSKESDIRAFGYIDENYYCLGNVDTSLNTVTTYSNNTNYKEGYYKFSYVTGTVGIEKNSKKVANNGTLEYNASNSKRVVNFSGLSKKDVYGKVYNNSVTINPWSSKILIPNGSATSSAKVLVADANVVNTNDLSFSAVTLEGSGKVSEGDTITRYSWAKIAGPSTGTIASPDSAHTELVGLEDGTYEYELTVTDNTGAVAKKSVQLTVDRKLNNLLPAVDPANTVNGLDYKYYEGALGGLPSFNSLKPVKTGTVENFDASVGKNGVQSGYSFSGYIHVPSDGMYRFYSDAANGSKIYIDEVLTVSNEEPGAQLTNSGVIGLKAGKHAIRGLFIRKAGQTSFEVSYETSGIKKQAVPSSDLYRVQLPKPVIDSMASTAMRSTVPAKSLNNLKISSYPNPSTSSFALFVQGGSSERIEVTATDASGRSVYQATGFSNKYYRFGDELLPGMYIVRVVQGNNVQTLKLMKL